MFIEKNIVTNIYIK